MNYKIGAVVAIKEAFFIATLHFIGSYLLYSKFVFLLENSYTVNYSLFSMYPASL